MKFTTHFIQLVAVYMASALAIAVDKVEEPKSSQDMKRSLAQCVNPGEHMCAVITESFVQWTMTSPDSFGATNDSGVTVVNGNCQPINTSGALEPQSPGFKADYTIYGNNHVEYHASYLGAGDIGEVWFTYAGKTYKQAGCQKRNGDMSAHHWRNTRGCILKGFLSAG